MLTKKQTRQIFDELKKAKFEFDNCHPWDKKARACVFVFLCDISIDFQPKIRDKIAKGFGVTYDKCLEYYNKLKPVNEAEEEESVFDESDRAHADWLIDPDMGDQ